MATGSVATGPVLAPDEACKQMFGTNAADVIFPLKLATEALGWLESLLAVIEEQANGEKPANTHRMQSLVSLARFVAADYAESTGCYYEQYDLVLQDSFGRAEVQA